jgi:hypothetical protein
MNRRIFLPLGLVAVLLTFFSLTLPAQASPQPQLPQYATPTAGPDGRIIYIVQPGDNCTSISLKTGVSIDLLLAQNPILDCALVVTGQQLLLGLGGPSAFTPTAGPSPTATPITPTPTPFAGTTEICVLLYEDVNGDSLRQPTEMGLLGGQVSVTDINGAYSQAKETTNALDPDTGDATRTCFADVPEGTFNVSVAVPDNYNSTTFITYRLDVKAGDRAFVDFGAQSNAAQIPGPTTAPEEGPNIPVMGIVGALLLLGGVGMGWYGLRMRKPSSKFGGRGTPNR